MNLRTRVERWLAAASIVVLGIADYLTGPDIGFSLFYLAPIAWAAWTQPDRLALLLALIAGGSWMTADFAWHGITPVPMWNGFTRLAIYIGTAYLVNRVRDDRKRLAELNTRLEELLVEEQHLARTDPLTGLANRRMFFDELRRAVGRSHRSGTPIALAYLDLDNFKVVNNRLGHPGGDGVLQTVAEILARDTRAGDVAARLGGDEFAVLLDRSTEETARTIAGRLLDQLTDLLNRLGDVSVSIGVACFDAPQLPPEAMIDHADAAMYCAKSQGRGQIYVVRIPRSAAPSAVSSQS